MLFKAFEIGNAHTEKCFNFVQKSLGLQSQMGGMAMLKHYFSRACGLPIPLK